MTNADMMLELELRGEDMELLVAVDGVLRPIVRVEDDSQGTYIIVDALATAQEEW
jgi:hypothetical protein